MPVLARRLLGFTTMAVVSLGYAAGCVIPPPGEVQQDFDAGVLNSPPALLAASPPELDFPGPLVVVQGDQRQVTLTLSDNDIDDTLHVRFFRDYRNDAPTPPLNATSGEIPVSGGVLRLGVFGLGSWCNGTPDVDPALHLLEVMVADREFVEGEPLFRALPIGASPPAFRAWTITCEGPL
jgi:hypothetical protein